MIRASTRHRLLQVALTGLACAFALQVFAQSEFESAGIVIHAKAAAQPSPWILKISGNWPTHCTPTLEQVALDGSELRIEARSVLSLCPRHQTRFSVEVNPALATNRSVLAPGVYHVGFYAASGDQGLPKLRAFSLLENGAPTTRLVPESGFWWNSSDLQNGTHRVALSLELQGSQLSAAFLSYDDAGDPVWRFGTAVFNGRIAHIPLLKMSGGSDPFATNVLAPRGEQDLTLDLEFRSSAHASAWLTRYTGAFDDAGLDLKAMDLVRLPSVDVSDASAWEGDWVLTGDTASTMQRLHLQKAPDVDGWHFDLADADADMHLVCERGRIDQLPQNCRLVQASGKEIGKFTTVSISRIEGVRSDGTTLRLTRDSR